MKYNLAIHSEREKAVAYLNELIAKDALCEVKKISPHRTLNQNSYLHLIIAAFGQNFGYTLAEAKIIYKKMSPEIYVYEKQGNVFLRSSADLTKEEMAKTIDRFMQKSKELGYPLPLATDKEWLINIENIIEQSGYYL